MEVSISPFANYVPEINKSLPKLGGLEYSGEFYKNYVNKRK